MFCKKLQKIERDKKSAAKAALGNKKLKLTLESEC